MQYHQPQEQLILKNGLFCAETLVPFQLDWVFCQGLRRQNGASLQWQTDNFSFENNPASNQALQMKDV